MTRARAAALVVVVLLAGAPAPGRAAVPSSCPDVPFVPGDADETCEPAPPPESNEVPDLNAIKTPESPAFMALGLAPSEIQRPTTPTGLALAVASGVIRGVSVSPLQDFALEVSPYWLLQHPRLTAQDLEQQRWRSIYRNLSLSAAVTTTKVDVLVPGGAGATTPVDFQRVAAGLRTTLLQGRLSGAALACRKMIGDFTARDAWTEAEAEQQFITTWTAANPMPAALKKPEPPDVAKFGDMGKLENRERFLAAQKKFDEEVAAFKSAHGDPQAEWLERRRVAIAGWRETYEPKLPEPPPELTRCLDDIHHRVGLMAELAGAWAVAAPNGDLSMVRSAGSQSQIGWLTAGYVFGDGTVGKLADGLDVSVLAALRVQHQTAAMLPTTWLLDAGGRLILAWSRYGVSLEGVLRDERPDGGDWAQRWRAAVSIDYRVGEGTWLTATFGKDFGTPIADDQPLLALANLQWNFGRDRTLRPDASLTRSSVAAAGASP